MVDQFLEIHYDRWDLNPSRQIRTPHHRPTVLPTLLHVCFFLRALHGNCNFSQNLYGPNSLCSTFSFIF